MTWSGIRIKNITITPPPTSWGVGVFDLDLNSERSTSGLLYRDRVAVKRKITLKWDELTGAELAGIYQSVANIFVEVEYDDPETNTRKTGVFYASDRNADALEYKDGQIIWKEVGFSLTER